MKLTGKHVDSKMIDALIEYYSCLKGFYGQQLLKICLELKQRRAEDRQREFDNGSNNA